LQWLGVVDEELAERLSRSCEETELGCDFDTAVRNLRQDYEIDEISGDEARVRLVVGDLVAPSPAIMLLPYDLVPFGSQFHAIVLLGFRPDSSTGREQAVFMDPVTGTEEVCSSNLFMIRWNLAGELALVVCA